MDHKENQSPAQERKHNQLAELIRITWGFAKDFSVNEVRIKIAAQLSNRFDLVIFFCLLIGYLKAMLVTIFLAILRSKKWV